MIVRLVGTIQGFLIFRDLKSGRLQDRTKDRFFELRFIGLGENLEVGFGKSSFIPLFRNEK